jgi:hypothetical protein
MPHAEALLDSFSDLLNKSRRQSGPGPHLQEQKNLLIVIKGTPLANTYGIVNVAGESLKDRVYFRRPEPDAAGIQDAVAWEKIRMSGLGAIKRVYALPQAGAHLLPSIMIPFVSGLTTMKSP